MDIVYPVGVNADNDELRYSLRSAERHVPHERAWIIGYIPPWLDTDEAGVIPWVQGDDRFWNTSMMLMQAVRNTDISDPFQFWNDDFFALTDDPRMDFDRGSLRDQLLSNRRAAAYRTAAVQTLEMLESDGYLNPLSYELHLPMVVHKATMHSAIESLHDAGVPQALKRTVYGAIYGLMTETRPDVKVGVEPYPTLTDWVSTTDAGFREGAVGRTLRDRFPTPSRYEKKQKKSRPSVTTTTTTSSSGWVNTTIVVPSWGSDETS